MRQRAFLISLAVMFFVGVFDMTRSICGPLLQQSFGIDYAQLGYLFAAVSIGYLMGSWTCGWLVDHVGIRSAVLSGGGVTVIGFGLPALAHAYAGALVGFFCCGLGGSWMEVGVNAVIPLLARRAAQQTQLGPNPGPQSGMFNMLHGFYGIGAFIFPVAGSWFIHLLSGWRPMFAVLVGVLLVLLLAVAAVRFPRPERGAGTAPGAAPRSDTASAIPHSGMADEASQSSRATGEPVAASSGGFLTPSLVGLVLAITAYVMAEAGMGSWLPTYLLRVRHLTLGQSAVYLSGFYLTYTIGRLTGHAWVDRVGQRRSIVGSVAAAVVLVVLGEVGGGWNGWFVLAGFGFAVVFPTITALASEQFPSRANRVLGVLFTFTGAGVAVTNWLIGGLANWLGLQAGFSVIPICLAITLVGMAVARTAAKPAPWHSRAL
ncbi:MAG: MFS transporter [Alicyclobacillus sp.]|nr:MFS transporter [Alicyclobacillus sp.]